VVRGCDRAWTIAAACLAVALGACGDDTSHGSLDDTGGGDDVADTTAGDTAVDDTSVGDTAVEDTSPPDVADTTDAVDADATLPPGTILAEGIVAPPDGSSPIGWRVINRFATVAVSDPDGAFAIPITADGLTPTLAAPPGAEPGDTTLLLTVASRIPERDPEAPPLLRLDAPGTAAALVVAHPALADEDAFRTREVLAAARAHRAVAALASRLASAWPAGGRLLESGDVADAYADAALVVARALTPAWPDETRVATPHDEGELTVRPLDDTPVATAAPTATGDLRFTLPAGAPLAAVASVAPLEVGGAHSRIGPDGAATPLPVVDETDLLALRDLPAGFVSLATAGAPLRRAVGPEDAPELAEALAAESALDDGPLPLTADGAWVASLTTGAVAGTEAVRAWRDAPDDAWAALRANLLGEARRIVRWAAPDTSPTCVTAPVPDANATRDGLRADVLAGRPGPRFAALYAGRVGAVSNSCLPPGDPAAPWLAPLVTTAAAVARGPIADGLTPSPESPLRALRHGRAGWATGRLLILRGAPLAPRVESLATVLTADTVAEPPRVLPGEKVTVTGARLDGTRVELVDPAGRLRTTLIESNDAGVLTFRVPLGIAGIVSVTPASAGGRGAPAWLEVAPRVDRILPELVYRGGGPVTLRVEGAGFSPGQTLALGLATTTVPDDAEPDHFELAVDPTTLAPGLASVLVWPASAEPEQGDVTGGTLYVADPPVVLDAAPSPLRPGQTLRLSCLRVGLDPDAVEVTLTVGGVSMAAPVRAIAPGDGAGEVVVTATAPDFTASGFGVAAVTTPSGTGQLTVALAQAPARMDRQIRFHAVNPSIRTVRSIEAFSVANGSQPVGEFTRVDSGWSDGGEPWCPLDVQPSMFALPAASCSHPSGICDDGWAWQDLANPNSWLDVTAPPGRLATGACAPVAGIASWEELDSADDVYDRVSTTDPLDLGEAPALWGPAARLDLPDARGGGFFVRTAEGGVRNDVTLDLVVKQATGTVVTLDGVRGVHVARLEIVGAPGLCDVGLRITGSEDVRIDDLDVSGCATGVVVVDSQDVRTTAPMTLFGDIVGVRVTESTDVSLSAEVGYRAQPEAPGYAIATGQTDGVVVEDSDRVWLDLPTAVALGGDAVRVKRSRDVRVSGVFGFVPLADGSTVSTGTAVDVGVRLGDGVERARLEGVVVLNARDGIALGAVNDVLVAGAELGIRALVGASETLAPGNRGAGIRVAPFAGIDGVVLRDLVVGRNAEAGIRVEIAEGDLRVERVTSGGDRDGGGLVPGAQPCLLSAVYTTGLRARNLSSRGDVSGLCVVGSEDVILDGVVVDAASAEGALVSQSSAVLLRDLTVDAPGTDGVRLESIGSVALEQASITAPNGDGVRVTGTVSPAGHVDLLGLTIERPLGNGVDSRATGGLVRLHEVEVRDPGLPGIRAESGALRIDDALVTVSPGAAPAAASSGLDVSGTARVDAEGLIADGLAGAGVRAVGPVAVRLGAATRLRDNGGVGIALTGAARAVIDGARVYDNALGALRADDLEAGSRLVTRDAELDGGDTSLSVNRCAGDDGVIDLRGGALGGLDVARCEHPVRVEGADVGGDLSLDRVTASAIGRAVVHGALLLRGGGDHRLDATQLVDAELHLAGAADRGARLTAMPGVIPVADDAVSEAHVPSARVDEVLAGPGGATLAVSSGSPHARIEVGWRSNAVTAALASVSSSASGAALARGVSAPAGQGEWRARPVLPDGSAGGGDADAACRAPDAAPSGTAAGVAWLDGSGGVGGTTLALPGALAASACGAKAVWSAAPGGQGGDLWLLDVASGDVTPLTNGGDDDREPTLGPGCDAVAWVASGSGGVDLMIADVTDDGVGAPTALTSDVAIERSPLLTAAALYYARRAPGDQDFILMRRDRADLSAPAEVVYDGPGDDLWPAASADGAWLAWTRCPAGEAAPCGLAVMGPGGGATALVGADGRCDDRRPAFWTDADGATALVAVRRPVAHDDTLGAARLVTLTRFGRATWALTDGTTPVLAPFVTGGP